MGKQVGRGKEEGATEGIWGETTKNKGHLRQYGNLIKAAFQNIWL